MNPATYTTRRDVVIDADNIRMLHTLHGDGRYHCYKRSTGVWNVISPKGNVTCWTSWQHAHSWYLVIQPSMKNPH